MKCPANQGVIIWIVLILFLSHCVYCVDSFPGIIPEIPIEFKHPDNITEDDIFTELVNNTYTCFYPFSCTGIFKVVNPTRHKLNVTQLTFSFDNDESLGKYDVTIQKNISYQVNVIDYINCTKCVNVTIQNGTEQIPIVHCYNTTHPNGSHSEEQTKLEWHPIHSSDKIDPGKECLVKIVGWKKPGVGGNSIDWFPEITLRRSEIPGLSKNKVLRQFKWADWNDSVGYWVDTFDDEAGVETQNHINISGGNAKLNASLAWHYQEKEDSGYCGGQWHASGPCSNVNDSDWSSLGYAAVNGERAMFYFNYTEYPNSNNNSLIQWKAVATGIVEENISIHPECWKNTPKQFYFTSYGWSPYDAYLYCIGNNSVLYELDGNAVSRKIYEAGVWWRYSQYQTGNLTSVAITPTYLGVYDKFCTDINYSMGSNATFMLLNASNNESITGFDLINFSTGGSCLDIGGLSTDYSSLRLFLNGSTNNDTNTFNLFSWNLTWNTSVQINENYTLPSVPDFSPKNLTYQVNATSTTGILFCNLTVFNEDTITCVINNTNMSHHGDFWNHTQNIIVDGIYNWSVVCGDDYGQTDIIGNDFSVYNDAPENLTCSISPLLAGATNNLTGNSTGADQEGATLTWSWLWFKNGITTNITNQILGSDNTSLYDNYTLRCNASDGYNNTLLNSSIITIGDDTPANISNDSVNPTSGTVGLTSVNLTIDVYTDSVINWVKLEITTPDPIVSNVSMTHGVGNEYSYVFTPSSIGTYTFKCSVLDGSGNVSNITFGDSYSSIAASGDGADAGSGSGETIIIVIEEEKDMITININPLELAPLSGIFEKYPSTTLNFGFKHLNDTLLTDTFDTDRAGRFVYEFPLGFKSKLRVGGMYNLTYYTREGIALKVVKVVVVDQPELWGILPKHIIYTFSIGTETKCQVITVFSEKTPCTITIENVGDVETTAESVSSNEYKICVSNPKLEENEQLYSELIVTSSCYETPEHVTIEAVRTTCPDFKISFLVGVVSLFNIKICKMYFLMGNVLLYGGLLFHTTYKQKSKKKFDWLIATMYLGGINIIIFTLNYFRI